MKLINTLKKYWYLITTILLISFLIPPYFENLYKGIFISVIIILWCILGTVWKNLRKSSMFLIFLILPFNISYQLPYSVLGITLCNPFVNGIIVNYLIPTLHILDLGVFLLLLSLIFEKRIDIKWRGFSFIKLFLLFALFLVIQYILTNEFLTVFNGFRYLLYIFTFYYLLKNKKELLDRSFLKTLMITSVVLVVIQGLIALMQFTGGTSLGLSFLGESNVVSGMRGSSFIELNSQLYLRGYGTFPHPNVFGGWLMFNMFFGWFLYDILKKKRDYAIILMVLSSIVMVLTFSRIGYLITGLIWVVFLCNIFVRINTKKQKKVIKKEYGFIGLVSERVLNLIGGGDSSWSERLDLMRSSVGVIKSNLLVGTGLGRFVSSMESVRSDSGILILQPVHNVFLLLVSELGLIGFGLFSTLLYFFLRERKFTVRFVTVLFCLFIWGGFDHYWVSLSQGLVVFLSVIVL